MRIRPPNDAEQAAVRRALLQAAETLGIDPDEPLAVALFAARAELVAHDLVTDLARTDRRRYGLTYREFGQAFGITMQSAHTRFRSLAAADARHEHPQQQR